MKLWPSRAQWRAWTLPSKCSYLGLLFSLVSIVLGILLYFAPSAERLWPRPTETIPNITIHLRNSGRADVLIASRSIVWLWFPDDRYMSETYQAIPVQRDLLRDGLIKLAPHSDTPVIVSLMNQQQLVPLMKRGDLDITVWFRRRDGSLFSTQALLPFTKADIGQYYLTADANPLMPDH